MAIRKKKKHERIDNTNRSNFAILHDDATAETELAKPESETGMERERESERDRLP